MKITINKALTDLKLLDKKIEKLECSIQCIGLKLNSSEKIENSLKTVEDFQNSAIEDYQKLIDLIARYNKLKNLITISNATTQIKIWKETITVAEAINKKYTKEYEKSCFRGLFNFIKFIEKLHSSNGSDMASAKVIGENEDVVRIMSIHKSKGLEFPIVFLSSTSKKVNLQDLNSNLLLHQNIGIGPQYINYDKIIQLEEKVLSMHAIRCIPYWTIYKQK